MKKIKPIKNGKVTITKTNIKEYVCQEKYIHEGWYNNNQECRQIDGICIEINGENDIKIISDINGYGNNGDRVILKLNNEQATIIFKALEKFNKMNELYKNYEKELEKI